MPALRAFDGGGAFVGRFFRIFGFIRAVRSWSNLLWVNGKTGSHKVFSQAASNSDYWSAAERTGNEWTKGAYGLPGIGGGWPLEVLMLLEGQTRGRGRRRAIFGRVANRSMVLG